MTKESEGICGATGSSQDLQRKSAKLADMSNKD